MNRNGQYITMGHPYMQARAPLAIINYKLYHFEFMYINTIVVMYNKTYLIIVQKITITSYRIYTLTIFRNLDNFNRQFKVIE